MKFRTQHIVVKGTSENNNQGFKLHRQGKVTGKTSGEKWLVSDTIEHKSVAAAKKYMGSFTR